MHFSPAGISPAHPLTTPQHPSINIQESVFTRIALSPYHPDYTHCLLTIYDPNLRSALPLHTLFVLPPSPPLSQSSSQAIVDLREQLLILPGDALLAAAFVSYSGCFSKRFRKQLLTRTFLPYLKGEITASKGRVPLSQGADPLTILTSEAERAVWARQHLPTDRVSVENGAIVCNCARWPLLIDPQLQGEHFDSFPPLPLPPSIHPSTHPSIHTCMHTFVPSLTTLSSLPSILSPISSTLYTLISASSPCRPLSKHFCSSSLPVPFDNGYLDP